MAICLRINQSGKIIIFQLTKNEVILGRSSKSDIKLVDPKSSGSHCSLTLDKKGLLLKDLNSSNGTFLNGERIDEEYITLNDSLSIGEVTITVDEEQLSSEEKTLLSGEAGLQKGFDLAGVVNEKTFQTRYDLKKEPSRILVNRKFLKDTIGKGLKLDLPKRKETKGRAQKEDKSKSGFFGFFKKKK